ncbi:hypothetical protein BD311DRAFT_522623 [Dichomitus squalens]|uniref:Glutaminase A central domain-containing protein n=1 Tax=Dichomitus squalens TaxID=114155 RepID=A0A4Q9MG94_9APHY|nr:hypothetical protein BD311DRAFT_522623 [Dichomitus squalens]
MCIRMSETSWYNGKADTYGLILDTRNTYTKPDWYIFTAGIVTSTDVRDEIVSAVVIFAADGQNNLPLADWYDVNTGRQEASSANFARPVVGAHLALLALASRSKHDISQFGLNRRAYRTKQQPGLPQAEKVGFSSYKGIRRGGYHVYVAFCFMHHHLSSRYYAVTRVKWLEPARRSHYAQRQNN